MIVKRRNVPGVAALVFFLVLPLFPQEEGPQPVSFHFRGARHQVFVQKTLPGSDIVLEKEGKRMILSSGMEGENVCPSVRESDRDAVVVWVNYHSKVATLGWFSLESETGGVERPENFKFISSPQVVFSAGSPRALVFLGNRSRNDDVFVWDLLHKALMDVTGTAESEKRFSISGDGETLLIETMTLNHSATYVLGGEPLRVSSLSQEKIRSQETALTAKALAPCDAANTYVAFGDSITWGKMRMNNLVGDYHPELAYPAQIKNLIKDSYGRTFPLNLGIPNETTYDGVMRITTDLAKNPARYFMLMMGTNDTIHNQFSIDSSMENLEYIVDRALDRNLGVIISTIPPRNDSFNQYEYVRNNIQALNAGIRDLVFRKFLVRKSIFSVDTHNAFMTYNPPDGWKTLLEDVGGNHPSPRGHQVIAGLFSPVLLSFAPAAPSGIEMASASGNRKTFQWSSHCESDFDHYQIEFGFSPNLLNRKITAAESRFTFSTFPFLPAVYFRLQAVDRFENRSDFTQVVSAGAVK